MSEFTPKNIEKGSIQTGLSDNEKQLIFDLANIGREEQKLKIGLSNLKEFKGTNEQKKYHQDILNQIKNEIGVISELNVNEVEDILNKDGKNLQQKAVKMQNISPDYSAYVFSYLAKLKQICNKDFREDLKNAQKLSGQISKFRPSDLLTKAIILGVLKRYNKTQPMPKKESVAREILTNKELLEQYALVLGEEGREYFLNLIPEEKRKSAAILMDRVLSEVLKDEKTLSPDEADQQKHVKKRAENELEKIIKTESKINRKNIHLLSKILATIGDSESKKFLKNIIKQLLVSKEINKKIYLARIIRELSEIDNFSGGSLAMRFLGSEELPKRYFIYFRNYLFKNGFLQKNIDQAGDWSEEKCKDLFEFLVANDKEWQDEVNVKTPFLQGVKVFGWQKMLEFAGRPDVTRHDALFGFDKIINLFKQTGLTSKEFYGQILSQVHSDSSQYDSGTSYHELNEIVNSHDISNQNLESMRLEISRYSKIKELQELKEFLTNKEEIFSSWNDLKKFVDLSRILERAEILDQLEDLEEEAQKDPKKAKLCRFIKFLAFHRDSKVNIQKVFEFWRNPEDFLEIMDSHTPEEIQNAKKPSNYTEIPHLDLTAIELRDVLVDGTLDKIQSFPQMEVVYSLSQTEELTEELNLFDKVRREVGSRKDGTANRKLFNEIRKIFKKYKLNIIKFLQGENKNLKNLSVSDQANIDEELEGAIKKYPNLKIERVLKPLAKHYRARINLKSSPQAVVAGDDTACCMPFGSGKNNIYMFNPNCALFTLEEEKGNKWRTIAQSVLTLDADIEKPVSGIINQLRDTKQNLSEIIPESVLFSVHNFLSCDNIEWQVPRILDM